MKVEDVCHAHCLKKTKFYGGTGFELRIPGRKLTVPRPLCCEWYWLIDLSKSEDAEGLEHATIGLARNKGLGGQITVFQISRLPIT
jgi:hypothetical protein